MKQSRNLWPFGIIFAFVLFIMGTIGLVVMSCSQKLDLVSSDYYEQEIRFQRHLDQLDHARRLDQRASAAYTAATHQIEISIPTEPEGAAVSGRIHLYRPSAAGLDRKLALQLNQRGVQCLDATGLQPGLWKVQVSWTAGRQDYFIDQSIIVGVGAQPVQRSAQSAAPANPG